ILGNAEGACIILEANEAVLRGFARPEILARALCIWGRWTATARGDRQKAHSLFGESLAIGKELDPLALGYTYANIGLWSLQEEDYDAAWRYQMESLQTLKQVASRT